MAQPMPAPVSEPGAAAKKRRPVEKRTATEKPRPGSAPEHAPHAAGDKTVIECKGPFAKDFGMLALAVSYDARNMIFTHETVQGSQVGVTGDVSQGPEAPGSKYGGGTRTGQDFI